MLKNEAPTFDKSKISKRSKELLEKLFQENPELKDIMFSSKSDKEVKNKLQSLAMSCLEQNPDALKFYKFEVEGWQAMERLSWKDFAAIRILDYIDNSGRQFKDLNLRGQKIVNDPFKLLWIGATEGVGGTTPEFFEDMLHLFRQFKNSKQQPKVDRVKLEEWMDRFPSGLDERIVKMRQANKDRIVRILAEKIDKKEIKSAEFKFPADISTEQKVATVKKWWTHKQFHLRFAVRNPNLLNELLDYTIDKDTMDLLHKAEKQGIPFFVNPYYLSLLNVHEPAFAKGADLAIRYYVFYSKQLVEEYGHIVAWEKEDEVEPGKPNAAGWLLPTETNVHRRYPEVAILIPDTVGRACGGLCASCQRMYDFQRGNLNFNLKELEPKKSWDVKLKQIMKYWEEDSQLRDILITGGDALMNSDESLQHILDGVYNMALRKNEANRTRKDEEKYAELLRIRFGTRLPAYLPQRITSKLVKILSGFKTKASAIGVKQFVIQTHFQSPMEVTPEAKEAVRKLHSAGWIVTNQLVFTAAASRRGHTAKLRKVLNDIGVLPYYTFSVKGYKENSFKFATNARAVQEQFEEKTIGEIPAQYMAKIKAFALDAENIVENINQLRNEANIPFMATDRNMLNLPAVGKSTTFRVIGTTKSGRRILEFDHDHTRVHSPIIDKMGKVIIIESKAIRTYLDQIKDMGDDPADYESIWGYSIGETEPRATIYEYPEYDFQVTDVITNFLG